MKIKSQSKTGYRTGILLKDGKIVSKNTTTREEADDFILTAGEVKTAKIKDNKTNEIELMHF